jgi:hypothetical protein
MRGLGIIDASFTGDRGALDLGVQRTLEEPLVGCLQLAARLLQVDPVARHQLHDAPAHRCQGADLNSIASALSAIGSKGRPRAGFKESFQVAELTNPTRIG